MTVPDSSRALGEVIARGRGSVLLLGEPGIGKTHAVRSALAAADGVTTVTASAVDWEREQPYAVLAQLTGDDVADLADDDAFAAARRLLPGGRGSEGGAHPDDHADGRPTVLVVDDAHHADDASLRALSTLVRHHRRAAVVVVCVAVPGLGPAAVIDHLRRTAEVVVEPGPWSVAGIEELCTDRGRPLPPWLTARLRRHTRGNPRHVLALLDALPDDVRGVPDLRLPAPPEIAARVAEDWSALGDEARRLVETVACFAEPASLDEIARTAGIDDVLDPLSEAAARGLVVRVGGRSLPVVGPRDPMVRAAVLDLVGPARAAATRRRAAEVVVETPRRLALLAAATPGPDPGLADRLDEHAAARAADGAWSDAAHALLEAARLAENHDDRELLLIRAVDALIGAGQVFEAEALIPAVENLLDTAVRNSVLGYLAILRGRSAQAERALTRAWERCDPSADTAADPDVAAWVCQRRVLHALLDGDGPGLVAWADRAVGLVGRDHPAAVEALAMRGLGTAASGRPADGLAEYRAMTARVRHGAQAQRITMGQGWLHLVVSDLDEARAELESAIPTTLLGGSSRISLWASAWLARTRFLAGEWDLALRATVDGRRRAEETGIVIVTPLLAWTAAQIHALRGEEARAERVLRDVGTTAEEYEILALPRRLARAALAEIRSDYGAVLRALEPLTGGGEGTVDEPGWWPWHDVYANALVMEGRLDDAETFLVRHEACARDRRHGPATARLAWARGRLHAARGELDATRASFERAITALEGLALPWDRARAHFAYGQSLRRLAQRRDADTVLTTARELFSALGASSYVARCDRELRAGGVHRGRPERAAHELTAQESAVVDLVVRGRSNKDAAAELHVSVKTIQYHLTRIYAKLGVRSRTELARLDP